MFLFLAIFAAVAAGHPTHHRHYYKSSDDSDLVASPSPDPSLPDIPDTGPLPDIPAGFGPTTDPSIADPTMAGNDGQFSEKSVQVAIKDAVTDVKKSIFASAALDRDADKVKDSAAISALEADAEVKMRTLTKDMVALEVEIMKSKNTAELFKKTSSITIAKEEKKLAEKKAEYKKDRKETLAKIAQIDSVTKSKQEALRAQLQTLQDELKATKVRDAEAAAAMTKAQKDLVVIVEKKKAAIEKSTAIAKLKIDAQLAASSRKEQAMKDQLKLLIEEIAVKKSDAAQWVSTESADKLALLKVLGEKKKALTQKKTAGNDAYLKVANTLSDNEESINTLEDQLKKILYELSDGKAYLKTTNCTLPA